MITVTKQDVPRIAEKLYPLIQSYQEASAKAKSWRMMMDNWERAELARTPYEFRQDDVLIASGTSGRIMDPKLTYLMADEDFKRFFALRDEYVRSLKLTDIEDGYCPALMAEYKESACAHALVNAAEKFFGVTLDQLFCTGLEKYNEYLKLLVDMVLAYRRSQP